MATLAELRTGWAQSHDAMSDLTRNLKVQIASAQARVNTLEAPFREQLGLFEEQMRPLVTPDTPKAGHGVKITHRRAYNKVVWDGKGLEGYMVADKKLRNFRRVTKVRASTSFSREKDAD